MAALLIDRGATVDKVRDNGETPLYVAVKVSFDMLSVIFGSLVVDFLRWLMNTKTVSLHGSDGAAD